MSGVNDSGSNRTDTISNGSFNCPAKTCLYKTICNRDLQLHPTRKHLRSGYKFLSDIQQMSGHSFQSLQEQKIRHPDVRQDDGAGNVPCDQNKYHTFTQTQTQLVISI